MSARTFAKPGTALYSAVFGAKSNDAAEFMWKESGIFIDFYQNFARVLHSNLLGGLTCNDWVANTAGVQARTGMSDSTGTG